MKNITMLGYTTGILIIFLCARPTSLQAQESPRTIVNASFRGVVVDAENRAPIEGATVTLYGVTHAVTTNRQGLFTFVTGQNLPARVVVSYVGYQEQTATIRNPGDTVRLVPKSSSVEEVVVVGYGTQKRREFTGAAASVSSEDIKDIPVQSFDQALVGKAAGVSVSLPNGLLNNPPVIRVRGVNSISLSSYPLVVVDGIPINTGNIGSNNIPNNPLADINPADIESIDVLKDAASTSIYGSRAAGGVLLVTTKKGKAGRSRVTYDVWGSAVRAARLPKLLNAQQYIDIKNEAVRNSKILSGNQDNPAVADALFFPQYDEAGNLVETNWYDHVYQTGYSHNHSLAISGANEKTQYYMSANFSDQEGFFARNKFERQGIRFNIEHKVNDWFSVGSNLNYNKTFNDAQNSGSLPGSQLFLIGGARLATALPPNVAAYNPDGSYNLSGTGLLGPGANRFTNTLYNPAALFDYSSYTTGNDHILGNIHAQLQLAPGLKFTSTYAVDRNLTTTKTYLSPNLGSSGFSNGGAVTNLSALRNNWNFINTLNYDRTFGEKHDIGLLLGYDIQQYDNDIWSASQNNAADPFFENFQGSWATISAAGGTLNEQFFRSTFFRGSYNYDRRYFLTANFRRDGNSALGANNKYGDFGGVSAGWSIFEEAFYSEGLSNALGDLRVRASWGKVGNGNLSAFQSLNLYSSALYGGVSTWNLSQAGNPNLGWETSEQTNVGLTFGLLRNKLHVDVDYFRNNVNGLILNAPQSPSKGIPGNSIATNVGSMYNRGLEVAIHGDLIRTENFSWNAGLNITHVKNRVTALAEGNSDIIGYTHTTTEANNITRVGYSVGSLYGALTDGVNPENGQRIFINRDGERVQYSAVVASGQSNWTYLDGTTAAPITVADYQVLGNALPTYYGGFNNNFRYKDFDATVNFTFAGGNKIMNGTRGTLLDQRFYNNATEVLNRWTAPGQETDIPRLVYNDVISNGSAGFSISDNAEKADFLRLQQVVLGYTFRPAAFARLGLSSIRVYGQASNLFLLTGYTGADPESSSNGNSATSMGVEKNSIGLGRTWSAGLNVSF
ncbi:SusC/RagA family TonB-linked outer membrane protein [Sphingobacterium sp. lm-10]|uniref:SusC/RagA family TonB-linked outer membrane protein n=1 Tax=Sphingobacterium sp. lm-10 TaxID=2944904 RepID=UPI002020FF2C|nr:SusC/RagA family TonB-linked outer membrane protein [Sphingobacterium sp. lm-10]MCL7987248.1 SusC/RagA family TonB-linked outer membrane protein [Sphingobacterium sp. lm-10]